MSSVSFCVYPLSMLIKLRPSMPFNSNCKPFIVMTSPDGVISQTCRINSAFKAFGARWKRSVDGIGSCSGSLHSSECLPSHTSRQAVNMAYIESSANGYPDAAVRSSNSGEIDYPYCVYCCECSSFVCVHSPLVGFTYGQFLLSYSPKTVTQQLFQIMVQTSLSL